MTRHLVVTVLLAIGLILSLAVDGQAATASQHAIRSADPIVYGLGSFVLPGLGQFMLGDRGTALTHFVVAIAIPTACYYVDDISPFLPVYPVCSLASLAWHAFSGIDAHDAAAAGRGLGMSWQP